jgi:hypothetical protein
MRSWVPFKAQCAYLEEAISTYKAKQMNAPRAFPCQMFFFPPSKKKTPGEIAIALERNLARELFQFGWNLSDEEREEYDGLPDTSAKRRWNLQNKFDRCLRKHEIPPGVYDYGSSFVAKIMHGNIQFYLGTSSTPEGASEMYFEAVRQILKGTFETWLATRKQATLRAQTQERARTQERAQQELALVQASRHTGHIPAGLGIELFRTATAASNLPLHLRSIAAGLGIYERARAMYGRYQDLGCSSSMLINLDGELQLAKGTLIAAKSIVAAASTAESKKRKAPVALCPLPARIDKKSKYVDIQLEIREAADKVQYSPSGKNPTSATLAALVGILRMTYSTCRKQPEKSTLGAGLMFWD